MSNRRGRSGWRVRADKKKLFHGARVPTGWRFEDFLACIPDFAEPCETFAHEEAARMAKERHQRFGKVFMAVMHSQDGDNFELDRSRRCVIFYAAPNGCFYPFCTWNSGPCHRYRVEDDFSQPLAWEA